MRILQITLQLVCGKIGNVLVSRVDLSFFREPAIVKANAITAASEATCLLLSVDETVKNPRSGQGEQQMGGGGMPMGRGRGRPM